MKGLSKIKEVVAQPAYELDMVRLGLIRANISGERQRDERLSAQLAEQVLTGRSSPECRARPRAERLTSALLAERAGHERRSGRHVEARTARNR